MMQRYNQAEDNKCADRPFGGQTTTPPPKKQKSDQF